ncbi:4Fe-4S dicluster domain-containing protein [Maridesulfovibrio ferrireducens]|uniref:glutamate synthase (NADPH) n=1 Tax=Maridesulfovibrio ferrireducens TaxID=246191 RepID=A0A1G9HP39_9BACT|nr:4Fe-4S dicluster domain-containing protein [Maridesulfovibrio ferrireducens]
MLFHKLTDFYHEFVIERDKNLCIDCDVCIRQCSYGVHFRDAVRNIVDHDNSKCVGCQRCSVFCPTGALITKNYDSSSCQNELGQAVFLRNIYKQAETGEVLSSGLGANAVVPCYWDKLLLDTCLPDNFLNDLSLSTQFTIENPILFGTRSSNPINSNLFAAMKSAAGKLGMDFDVADKQHGEFVAAGHNVADMSVDAVRSGADIVFIEAQQLGRGPFSTRIHNAGMPIELAIAVVDQKLRDEGLRDKVSVVAEGNFRCSADVVKAIALGANAVCIGNAAMAAVGCTCCGQCHTGKCPWGIATTDPILSKRQNPEIAAEKLVNLVSAWNCEIKLMLSAMGLSSLDELRGNRDKLRAVGLSDTEMTILDVKHSGQ